MLYKAQLPQDVALQSMSRPETKSKPRPRWDVNATKWTHVHSHPRANTWVNQEVKKVECPMLPKPQAAYMGGRVPSTGLKSPHMWTMRCPKVKQICWQIRGWTGTIFKSKTTKQGGGFRKTERSDYANMSLSGAIIPSSSAAGWTSLRYG